LLKVKQVFPNIEVTPEDPAQKKGKAVMESISSEMTNLATALAFGAGRLRGPDLMDMAIAGIFNTLVALWKAADLVDTLKGPGPFTVFAPTDEAFAKLPPGALDGLLKPEDKAQLQAILKYHVIPGRVMAKDLGNLNSAKTLEGQDISVYKMGGNVMVNNAAVTGADIGASNGVIHVIDNVILLK
jgi:uncharacterized surface protein with fasciclin (FAS1) repeats